MHPDTAFFMNHVGVDVFSGSDPGAPSVCLVCDHGEGPECISLLRKERGDAFPILTFSVPDWGRDLSPWEAPAVFRNEADFGGQADVYLANLIAAARMAEHKSGLKPEKRILAGYSLAGLFCLWAAYQTDFFQYFGSASGSTWFPGFAEFAKKTPFRGNPGGFYLSIGDKEKKTRNPLMKNGEASARELAELFSSRGVPSIFELNPGNHFQDSAARTAKAALWLLDRALES